MKTLSLLIGFFGLVSLCQAQSGAPKAQRPTPKAKATAKCAMSMQRADKIEFLMVPPFSIDDAGVEEVQKSWSAYNTEATVCVSTAIAAGDKDGQLVGAHESSILWMFESLYNEAQYNREVDEVKAFQEAFQKAVDSQNTFADELSRLRRSPPPGPLFQEPTAIHMMCVGGRDCSGEILSPSPLPILSFHMHCLLAGQEVECDGAIMP
jgi:hypothetical protein